MRSAAVLPLWTAAWYRRSFFKTLMWLVGHLFARAIEPQSDISIICVPDGWSQDALRLDTIVRSGFIFIWLEKELVPDVFGMSLNRVPKDMKSLH